MKIRSKLYFVPTGLAIFILILLPISNPYRDLLELNGPAWRRGIKGD
jgi:hypothetical protein